MVGYGFGPTSHVALVWNPKQGTRPLAEVLRARGVEVPTEGLYAATFISADGRTIVGTHHKSGGRATRAWVATLPLPECD